jgi:hypothetical protein
MDVFWTMYEGKDTRTMEYEPVEMPSESLHEMRHSEGEPERYKRDLIVER